MKKFLLCLFCLVLIGCDDNHIIGKFLMHEEIVVDSENNYTKVTKYICGCFQDFDYSKSYKPLFIVSEPNAVSVHDKNRDNKCTKLCKKENRKEHL